MLRCFPPRSPLCLSNLLLTIVLIPDISFAAALSTSSTSTPFLFDLFNLSSCPILSTDKQQTLSRTLHVEPLLQRPVTLRYVVFACFKIQATRCLSACSFHSTRYAFVLTATQQRIWWVRKGCNNTAVERWYTAVASKRRHTLPVGATQAEIKEQNSNIAAQRMGSTTDEILLETWHGHLCILLSDFQIPAVLQSKQSTICWSICFAPSEILRFSGQLEIFRKKAVVSRRVLSTLEACQTCSTSSQWPFAGHLVYNYWLAFETPKKMESEMEDRWAHLHLPKKKADRKTDASRGSRLPDLRGKRLDRLCLTS